MTKDMSFDQTSPLLTKILIRPRDPRLFKRESQRPEPFPQFPQNNNKDVLPELWKGSIEMPGISEVSVSMQGVSKDPPRVKDVDLSGDSYLATVYKELPPKLVIRSRMSPKSAEKIVSEMSTAVNKTDVALVVFQPSTDSDLPNFIKLLRFLKEVDRCGLVGKVSRVIREMYIYPLGPHEQVAPVLLNYFSTGTFHSRYDCGILIGIVLLSQPTLAPLLYAPSVVTAKLSSSRVVENNRKAPSVVKVGDDFGDSFIPAFKSLSNPSVRSVSSILERNQKAGDIFYSPSVPKVKSEQDEPMCSSVTHQMTKIGAYFLKPDDDKSSFLNPDSEKPSPRNPYSQNNYNERCADNKVGNEESGGYVPLPRMKAPNNCIEQEYNSSHYEPDYIQLSSKAKMQRRLGNLGDTTPTFSSTYSRASSLQLSNSYLQSLTFQESFAEENGYVPRFIHSNVFTKL